MRITLPGEEARWAQTDAHGLARLSEIPPGECAVTFPSLDGAEWTLGEVTSEGESPRGVERTHGVEAAVAEIPCYRVAWDHVRDGAAVAGDFLVVVVHAGTGRAMAVLRRWSS